MSTLSLPTYFGPFPLSRAPSYTAETRNALVNARGRGYGPLSRSFIKESKSGGVILRLSGQEDNVVLPVYGNRVEGSVELSKTDAVESVELKIEGRLGLKEIAGSGTSSANLCLTSTCLWFKHASSARCPRSHPFSLTLPNTFDYEDVTYPLPPSFHAKLSGVPGFTATIEYFVTAIVTKSPSSTMATFSVKSLGISFGTTIVSTAFVYHPRSRPAKPPPAPLQYLQSIFEPFKANSEWNVHECTLQSRITARPNIVTKLYLPSSRTFSVTEPIPFYLTVESRTSVSLASFLPFSPTGNPVSARKVTHIQLMRQSAVDVRHAVMALTKGEMWRIDCIGEGTFSHVGDGHTWMSYSGQIVVDKKVRVGGFRAAGLTVKDCIVFSITPPDVSKSDFYELRQLIPIRLTTDAWSPVETP